MEHFESRVSAFLVRYFNTLLFQYLCLNSCGFILRVNIGLNLDLYSRFQTQDGTEESVMVRIGIALDSRNGNTQVQ